MRKLAFALPLAIVAIAAVPAHAEEPTAKTARFIEKATVAGMFEVEAGRLAQTQATNPEVKKFADTMVEDHTKANAGLKAAVASSGLTNPVVPTALDKDHSEKIAELKEKSGNDFNEEYIDEQEDAHEDAVTLFKSYSEEGDNPALKKFAAETLPKLEAHLNQVRTLDKAVN